MKLTLAAGTIAVLGVVSLTQAAPIGSLGSLDELAQGASNIGKNFEAGGPSNLHVDTKLRLGLPGDVPERLSLIKTEPMTEPVEMAFKPPTKVEVKPEPLSFGSNPFYNVKQEPASSVLTPTSSVHLSDTGTSARSSSVKEEVNMEPMTPAARSVRLRQAGVSNTPLGRHYGPLEPEFLSLLDNIRPQASTSAQPKRRYGPLSVANKTRKKKTYWRSYKTSTTGFPQKSGPKRGEEAEDLLRAFINSLGGAGPSGTSPRRSPRLANLPGRSPGGTTSGSSSS